MTLDLGALLATVDIETVSFDRKYIRLVRQFSDLGPQAERAAAGTTKLDGSLAGLADTSTAAATGTERVAKASTQSAAAQDKAAVATQRNVSAQREVGAILERTAGLTAREQQAVLRLAVAQERLSTVQASGVATTRQLAGAQATMIGAERSLAAAQNATVASAERSRGALAGTARSVAGLGIVFGGLAAVKKALDISKEANEFQRDMTLVQTNAGASAAEVTRASDALLKMAGPVAAAPKDLAVAFYHAKSVGLDYADSLKTVRIAAEGARVGNADVEETMNALTSTVASGIPGVKNMSSAMGQLIAIVGSGDMKLADLNQALGSGILSVVKGYGLSLRDVGAALATFGDNNIRGADAATMLRMAVQAMAVPAKAGLNVLRDLGLSSTQLGKDMQSGGLMKAVHDLKDHLDAAGVSSSQVGAVLTEIFGKRAGPGLQVLIGQMDRLDTKYGVLGKAGDTFASKWTATTHTASVALARLGHGIEANLIIAAEKASPVIAKVASWLADTLPHAIQTTYHILQPLISDVGGAFVGAWHAAAAVLRVIGSALSSTGHFLSDHRELVANVARAVLVMWGAWKGYQIVRAAAVAIDGAMLAMSRRMTSAAGVMAGLRGSLLGLGILGGVTLAAYGLGRAITNLTEGNRASAHIGSWTQNVQSFRDALQQANGVVNDSIRLDIEKKLQDAGLAQRAAAAGISLAQLTTGVTGSDAALKRLIDTWKASGKPAADSIFALDMLHMQYKQGSASAKELNAALKDSKSASNTAATGIKHVATAEEQAAAAAKHLDNALKALSGRLSSRQALDQFRQSVQGMKSQLDKSNHSLDGSSKAAVTNRLAMDNAIQGALSYADALRQQGKTAPQVNSALQGQIRYLIDNARQMGVTRGQLRDYLRSLGLLPRQIHTRIGLDTADARRKAQELRDYINGMRAAIRVSTVTGTKTSDPRLSAAGTHGGVLPHGWSWVGEGGAGARPELTHTTPRGTEVYSHPQAKAIARAVGWSVPGGYAGGTGKPDTQAIATAIGNVGSASAGPKFQVADVGINRVMAQLAHATAILREQIAKGLSHHAITVYRGEINALARLAHRELADLRVKIRGSDLDALRGAFKGAVQDVRDASKQLITDMQRAGATPGQLAKARAEEATMLAKQTQLIAARNRLATITDYTGSIRSTLAGATDLTKAGSVADLEATLQGGTDRNASYATELKSLRSRAHGNKTLLGLINSLAAQGNTTTLETLYGASGKDLRNVTKDLGAYNQSLTVGADSASLAKFGQTQSGQQAVVNKLNAGQMAQAKALHALATAIHHGFVVQLDGERIAHATIRSHEFAAVFDELESYVRHGRR